MDSSFSLDKFGKTQNYRSSKNHNYKCRSRDKCLNKKRERSSSNKKHYENYRKSNKVNRSDNKINSYGKYREEIDYPENKNKYRQIDIKIDVYPYKNSEIRNKGYKKKDYSGYRSRKDHSSESEDSRDVYSRKHKYTYSTKNLDYSRERRNNKNRKLKRSYSNKSRDRKNNYKKRSGKRESCYKNIKTKYYNDCENSFYEKKHKSNNKEEKRVHKKKRSRSSYYRYMHKKCSRSYSPDRDHSYGRLGYHKKGKHKVYEKKIKYNSGEFRDYSKNIRRESFSRDHSRSYFGTSSRFPSASRRSYSSSIRSKSASSSYSGSSRKNKDAGHYEFKVGNILNNKYKVKIKKSN
jgi:hypothetical protein